MIPVPRVSVKNSDRYPNNPRAGMRYSKRTNPCPGFFISIISPRRGPIFFDHLAEVFLGHVDRQLLVRLGALAVRPFARDHARTRHLELVPLASHRLHQDREVQLAAPRHRPRIRRIGVLHAQRDVPLELLVQTLAHLTRRDELPFLAGEGRVVDDEVDRDRRLLDGDALEPFRMLDVRDRQSDLDALEPGQRDDLARLRLGTSMRSSPSNDEQLRDPRLLRLLVRIERQQRD